MLPLLGRALAALVLLCGLVHAAPYQLAEDPSGRLLLETAQRAISAYHAGHATPAAERPRLRVVYFYPSDRDPLPDYAARLDRALTDVSAFYRDGLSRFGVASEGLPLERQGGRLVLHLVRGQHPASAYKHESGDVTVAEARAALKGVVDFDHDFVLILYALCRREPDGRYVFDAPYYGDGSSNQRRGLCHAADCELLDPQLLTETGRKMVFTEHYYPRREETIAAFNTMYLGGIAHELGHGFGLDHDAGQHDEQRFGTSLMGGGNLTYRAERWGGRAPAFLARSSALQFASHPLITGSNHGREQEPGLALDELRFTARERTLSIQGRLASPVAPYGVIAYVWPVTAKTNHSAQTFAASVAADGSFTLALGGLRPAAYHLQLKSLHVNGGTAEQQLEFEFDRNGQPDAGALTSAWLLGRARTAVLSGDPQAGRFLTEERLAPVSDRETLRQLAALRAIVASPPVLDLATVTGPSVFLSDVAWTEARVGWGEPRRNQFWFSPQFNKGALLFLGGKFYDRGLYAHASSRYVFDVGGKWRTFTATIGLRDGADPKEGSAVFILRGDGRELYRSALLRRGASAQATADVSGVKQLELIAEGGEGHTRNSWAVWLDPVLQR
jgi:hypothetical protein